MSKFIVISSQERLNGIVDGIEGFCPLNATMPLWLATGRVRAEGKGIYKYEYTVKDGSKQAIESDTLDNLLANQLAQFRLIYGVGQKDMINVFLLEEHTTQDDISTMFRDAFDKVYGDGKGRDTAFRLFRIVVAYDVEHPDDVNRRMPSEKLSQELHISPPAYEQYILLLDSQRSDSAAISSSRKEHELKLPRMLADFMMLVSDGKTQGQIMGAIAPATCQTRCFSIGYGESMYYFSDVRRYYELADHRDLLRHLLEAHDTTTAAAIPRAMDVELQPVGLRERLQRLRKYYDDVPYCEKLADHPQSADSRIDKALGELRPLVESYGDTFIDRMDVWRVNEDKRQAASTQYEALLDTVLTPEFADHVKASDNDANAAASDANEQLKTQMPTRSGCWPWWPFPKPKTAPQIVAQRPTAINHLPQIDTIRQLRKEKRQYSDFEKQVNEIEGELKEKESECRAFTLTDHDNHYFPLIDLFRLRDTQADEFKRRLNDIMNEWQKQPRPALNTLCDVCRKSTNACVRQYRYIDWRKPFPFIATLLPDENMPSIVNQLDSRAAPWACYTLTPERMEQKVTRILFSDRPTIQNDFKMMRPDLTNGNTMTSQHTAYAVSKICLFQLLPIDEEVKGSLTALYNTVS